MKQMTGVTVYIMIESMFNPSMTSAIYFQCHGFVAALDAVMNMLLTVDAS